MKNFGISLFGISLDNVLGVNILGVWTICNLDIKSERSLLGFSISKPAPPRLPTDEHEHIASIPLLVAEEWGKKGINVMNPSSEDSERMSELLDGEYSYLKREIRKRTYIVVDLLFFRFSFGY